MPQANKFQMITGMEIAVALLCSAFFLSVSAFKVGSMAWVPLVVGSAGMLISVYLITAKLSETLHPGSMRTELTVSDTGFHIKRPWRKLMYVPYTSICKIIASSGIAGHGESETTLYVYSPGGKFTLTEPLYLSTDLVSHLKALPRFDHHAWRISTPEDSRWFQYWGRRITLLK